MPKVEPYINGQMIADLFQRFKAISITSMYVDGVFSRWHYF